MYKKLLLPILCCTASLAFAEPQRTVLTTENKFPELGHLELGYDFSNREFSDLEYRSHEVFARFGLVENLTARVHVPFDTYRPDFGSSESGLGDVRVGLDLVAYQDVFSFPFIIPHVDVGFSTGDEDKNLGTGETMYKFGVAFGTKTHEQFVWVLDVSYAADAKAKAADEDDIFEVGLSWGWELSDRFMLSLEALIQDHQDTDNEPYLLGGGFSYKWTPALQTRFFMGGWQEQESGEDLVINVNASYSF